MFWKRKSGQKGKAAGRYLAVGIVLAVFFTGCGLPIEGNTKVVLTTGFEKDEIFRIEGISCRVPEIMVYLTNSENQY